MSGRYYNSARMRDVAIIGAGELGGLAAHVLARRNAARAVRLIDEAGRVAEGKALDIMQAAPVERFSTDVSGSTDIATAAGASVIVMAERAGRGEWPGDEALIVLERVSRFAPRAVLVCADTSHRELVERGVRERHVPRTRLLGSAPEALVAAARAMVALELDRSPADVALAVLGVPPRGLVIAWEEATVAGFAVTRLIAEPARRRLNDRIAALWPLGPYALAAAAAKIVESLLGGSRRTATCFVAPDDSAGIRARAAALPVTLDERGIVEVLQPTLNVAERVALDNAMLL